ncbi:site-specific integrase [Pseudofrankia sp. BMG5.36]|uniref:tyrosine-type recombinase/integrase n=1 Tax=Pseudofrankia sp. BMG5.36 TaxID=1834512 RepID=UPI0008D90190|nr:site-specific integrase [Pseudofrankia sp. BMG5.36]OHV44898.1 integrase [Pseudofrankia sp. BMG5.36]
MPRKRKEGTRAPNGAASIYEGNDGRWHGRVTMGVRDNGTPDRRHVSAKTETEVITKVRKLERDRDEGAVRKPGKPWTVEQWLNHWIENIVPGTVKDNTLAGYRVAVRVHLNPGVGKHRIDRLEPEHLERLYAKMMRNGSKPATAHQAHRTIKTALNEAKRRKRITENPATLAKPPAVVEEEIEPYDVAAIKRLMDAAAKRRNSARWAIALALGLRQGETLGLKWADVDLEQGALRVRRNRLRPKWSHGCGGTCGKKHGGYCPRRIALRPETDDTKSRAGKRTIGLPDELVALLRAHQVEQARERDMAADIWTNAGWLFATPTGGATNPRTDYSEWKRLLAAAGLRDARLHDARHTAATVLLLLGVPDRAVMSIMGWSSTTMAARYQHLTAPIRRDIAQRVGSLLWAPNETKIETR